MTLLFFFQAEDGIRDRDVTGVQTCALPIYGRHARAAHVPGRLGRAGGRSMSEPFRVALIDDHGLCRRGLAELLELRAGMKVVGTTGNPDETVELLKTQKPDLAVMDLRMAPTDGLRVLQRLKDEGIAVPIVILTLSDSADDLATALRLGVRGY